MADDVRMSEVGMSATVNQRAAVRRVTGRSRSGGRGRVAPKLRGNGGQRAHSAEPLEPRVLLAGQPGFGFPGESFPVGDYPKQIAHADIDLDGDADLITADLTAGTVSVL